MTDLAPASEPVEFSIAVLCYRAEDSIIPFVEKLHGLMSMFRFNWEIVLVANYWPDIPDTTPDVVKGLSERLPNIRTLTEPKEGDMGWDMKRGLDACSGKFIGVIDGDGQFPVEAIFACFAKIKSEDLDFVKTYRIKRADGLYRNFISSIYNFLFRVLFPQTKKLYDVNSKPKIMKRSSYDRMVLNSTDWFIDAEIMLNALKLDLKIYELPVQFKPLVDRKSFVKWSAVIEFSKNLFHARWNYNRTHPE